MTSFTSFIQVTADDILTASIADYQARVPDWSPNDGAPEVIMAEVISLRMAALFDVFGQVMDDIYIRSGTSIDKIAFNDAISASVTATITLTAEAVADGNSHVIPADLQIDVDAGDGTTQTFAVANDVTLGPGDGSTDTGGVTLIAVDPGAAGSGLTGPASQAGPVLDFIDLITLVGMTTGGQDAEDIGTYIDRLSQYRQRASPKLVRSVDFQFAALDVAGVARCLVLDLYDASTSTADVPGCVTLCPIDAAGAAVSGTVLTNVQAATQDPSLNLLNLSVQIIAPTVTAFPVTFVAHALPGYDTTAVHDAAVAALQAYLSKANWGSFDPSGVPSWRESLTVRHGELYAVLNSVQGLDYVDSLHVNGVSDGDMTLTGPAALPNATVTGAVS